MSKKGVYIAIEGLDGSGKSSISDYIVNNFPFNRTREPGGTKFGSNIREILLHDKEILLTPETEILLMTADRVENLKRNIIPQLENGTNILSDRCYISTLAYQGGGKGLNISDIIKLNNIFLDSNIPDLIIFIDTPVNVCMERIKREKDKFESLGYDFYERVRDMYIYLSSIYPKKWVTVKGDKTPNELEIEIDKILKDYLIKY